MADSQDQPTRKPEDEDSFNYNRIFLSKDLREQICSQIADSTDSLPFWGQQSSNAGLESAEDVKSRNKAIITAAAAAAHAPDESGQQTPLPKDRNPLDGALLSEQKTVTEPRSRLDKVDTAEDEDETKRPGTLRRLTTRIKKTLTSGNSHAGK